MEEELYEKILRSFPNSICSGIRKKYEGYSGAPDFAAQYRPEKQSDRFSHPLQTNHRASRNSDRDWNTQ
jgi:hypothetical protein